jgi:ABC-2 type transport system ATP-binding protein
MSMLPSAPAIDPAAAHPPVILVDQFHKTYRDTQAVRGVTFGVWPGQTLGLIGPNGAGKTTTMRAACGIIPSTSGRLVIAGHDVAADPVGAKAALAYVPDDPNLFDALTVQEHLEFVAAAYRVRDHRRKANLLLAQFELTEKRNALAQELSRGMRQKVAICCAYLHDPKAVFLDEPLTGLDPRGIRTMKDSLKRLAMQGAAVVISSHLLSLVEDMCTHIVVLHRGQVLFHGSMDEARSAARAMRPDATLEDMFFELTEGDPQNGSMKRDAGGRRTGDSA